jgi:cytochrome c-type biogenesis protein CcmH
MNGWIAMIGVAAAAGAAVLLVSNARKFVWQPVLATLCLAMAGYAWQARPALPSVPAKAIEQERGAADALLKIRSDMDLGFGVAKMWLVTADGFAREGNYRAAAGYIQAGLREHPENPDLWSGLGVVLLLASDGDLTPPAKFAFARARSLAPAYPAPDYFEGLAALFARKPDETLAKWNAVLDRATPKAKYRLALESQIRGLEAMLAASGNVGAAPKK